MVLYLMHWNGNWPKNIIDYLYKEKVTFMDAVKLCASRGNGTLSY